MLYLVERKSACGRFFYFWILRLAWPSREMAVLSFTIEGL